MKVSSLMAPLFECGKVSGVTTGEKKKPICTCYKGGRSHKLVDGEIDLPALTDRRSICALCRKREPSSWDLPHFQFLGRKSWSEGQGGYYGSRYGYDYFYCGCEGWDEQTRSTNWINS